MFPQFRLKALILQKISECTTFKAPFFQDSIPQAPAYTVLTKMFENTVECTQRVL